MTTQPDASSPRISMAGPIVRPTRAGKTHYLRVETFDPLEVERATHTLCNASRNNAPVITSEGIQVNCKRCLKLDAMNMSR